MNWETFVIIAVIALALLAIFWGPILWKHNKTLFEKARKEAAVANNDLHNAIKGVEAKVDKAIANTSATVEAKKKELQDWLEKKKAEL